jgi:hypothetical protein
MKAQLQVRGAGQKLQSAVTDHLPSAGEHGQHAGQPITDDRDRSTEYRHLVCRQS